MSGRRTRQIPADRGRLSGMFIGDEEIVEKCGSADVLTALNEDPETQKGKATRPADARYRPAVEKKLAERTAI